MSRVYREIEKKTIASSPHSLDLRPAKHLWDVVEQNIPIMDPQLTNMRHLQHVTL